MFGCKILRHAFFISRGSDEKKLFSSEPANADLQQVRDAVKRENGIIGSLRPVMPDCDLDDSSVLLYPIFLAITHKF